MKTAQTNLPMAVARALAELKPALRDLYGQRLRQLCLYGSYARGDARPESDVDVLVVLDGEVQPGREISRYNGVVSAICLRHDLLIATLPISGEVLERGHSPFLDSAEEPGSCDG